MPFSSQASSPSFLTLQFGGGGDGGGHRIGEIVVCVNMQPSYRLSQSVSANLWSQVSSCD